LHDNRLIQPEFLFQIGLIGGIDETRGVEQDVDDVAGNDAQQHKNDNRDPEQGHEHQGEAPHDISKHLVIPVGVYSAKVRTGLRSEYAQLIKPGWRHLLSGGRRYLSIQTSS
jgi:hypothetical protein